MLDLFASHLLDSEPTHLREIPAEGLRVGMYITLNCSWFKHPFPLKSFRLTSQGQITTILSLGLKTVTVDVAKSDQAAFRPVAPPAQAKAVSPTESSAPATTAPASSHPGATPADPVRAPHESRPPATMAQYATTLRKADETFKQALADSTHMMKQICAGSEEGFETADQMVKDLSALVQNEANTSAIVSMLNLEALSETSALHALNVRLVHDGRKTIRAPSPSDQSPGTRRTLSRCRGSSGASRRHAKTGTIECGPAAAMGGASETRSPNRVPDSRHAGGSRGNHSGTP